MRDKTFFITDAHLGSGTDTRQREADLVAWLGDIESQAKRVVMLGDMFDFWFTYRHVVPRGHTRLLGKMAQMADNGVEFHFFIGNHDMWLFDYLHEEIGVVMHDAPEVVEWEGKTLLLGHGDGLDKSDRCYLFIKRVFRSRFNQWLFAGVHPKIGFSIAKRWSESSRKSHGTKFKHYLGDDKESIYLFCLAQQRQRQAAGQRPLDYCLFGHRHTPVVRPLDGAQYINVGNWIMNRNYAVFDGNSVQLLSWERGA